MSKRQKVNASSSSSEVDYVRLCEDIVQRIEEVLKCRQVLNPRRCKYLATRLSMKIAQLRQAVETLERYKPNFVPLLVALHRYYEQAEVLVKRCAEEDWCVAAVFLFQNSSSYRYILDHINTVGKKIFERAKKYSVARISLLSDAFLQDVLNESFQSESYMGDTEDNMELRKRLEVLANWSNSSSKIFGVFLAQQASLKQEHLARYLLNREVDLSRLPPYPPFNSEYEFTMWKKKNEPVGTWGGFKSLGHGSGAIGVWMTSWLGVPCAIKEFHEDESETIFLKEAWAFAGMRKHPCIVDFICCGNGEGKGDRFIVMELMEKSLFKLIEEREGMHFSLAVALDIIWQIADGVRHLHREGIAHRDLKPHNVVVKTLRSSYHEDYYCIKLVDFGSCKSEVEASKAYTMSYRGIGTTSYRAPEAHPSAHPQGLGKVEWYKADVYSFAMTCAHVFTLTRPFDDLVSPGELYMEILQGHRPVLPSGCPKKLVDLLKECWNTNPSRRPRFEVIYERLERIILSNMLVPFSTLKSSMMPSQNIGIYDIKEEQGEIKEEGHTSYLTAEDVSLCSEVISERDSKFEATKVPTAKLEF